MRERGAPWKLEFRSSDPLLFDNCIGRKRDVGGGVLAGLWRWVWVFGVSLRPGLAMESEKRQLTVTFQEFIAP